MRTVLDKLLRGGIRLCMLTGVAFTVTACYGTPPHDPAWEEEFQNNSLQVEQQMQNLIEEHEATASENVK